MSKKSFSLMFVLFAGAVVYGLFWYEGGMFNKKSSVNEEVERVQKEEDNKELSESYTTGGLSFKYPAEYKIVENESGEDQSLINFEKAPEVGFQLFVIPFDEEGPITAERIRQDIPDSVINDEAYIEIDSLKVFTFYGYEEEIGETFEAWFIRDGKLYQLTAYKGMDGLLSKIIKTMIFENNQ